MKIGMQELVVILIVVMIIFGPTQIPKLTKIFGKSIKSFREGMSEDDSETVSETETQHTPQKTETEDKAE